MFEREERDRKTRVSHHATLSLHGIVMIVTPFVSKDLLRCSSLSRAAPRRYAGVHQYGAHKEKDRRRPRFQ